MVLFELERATANYNGVAVLHEIDLKISAGERVAFVGPSGAGKSTLLSLLYQQRQQQVALVLQELALVKQLSVFHNTYIGRLDRHSAWYNLLNLVRPSKRELSAIRPILEKLDLVEKIRTPAGELSGGQQQRTAIARALFFGGEVFLGDEPVSSVDVHQARAVLGTINEAYQTVVLAMHDLSLALAYTDRIVGLKGGRIVFDRPTRGMKSSDLDPFYTSQQDPFFLSK